MNDEEKVTGKIESVQGNDELPAEEMDSKNKKQAKKVWRKKYPLIQKVKRN